MSIKLLPVEVFHRAISHLDLKSIHHLSLCNHATHERISSYSFYRLLTTDETTRSTLKVLAKNKLTRMHTISTLVNALLTHDCICCHKPTPYIFLPTAVRACFMCLHGCRQFQLIPPEIAALAYGVPASTFEPISLRTTAGIYSVSGGYHAHIQTVDLVNVVQARNAADQILGESGVDDFIRREHFGPLTVTLPLKGTRDFTPSYSTKRPDIFSHRDPSPEGEDLWPGHWCGDRFFSGVCFMDIVGMGCAPWPAWDKDKEELTLDRKSVFEYRVDNFLGGPWEVRQGRPGNPSQYYYFHTRLGASLEEPLPYVNRQLVVC